MRVLGDLSIGDVLAEWAMHECRGRLCAHVPAGHLDVADPVEQRLRAIHVLLQVRRDVIAALLAASPTKCVRVELTSEDLPRVRAMSAVPLREWATSVLGAHDADGSGDWVRSLAARGDEIEGPFLGVGRALGGPITLFDGMHRAAAWVAHLDAGREYGVIANIVLTEHPSPLFELPEGA